MSWHRVWKIGFVVLAVWLSATPSFAQRKGANFGGIPKALLDKITGEFTGSLSPGITLEKANDVLLRLIQEEHAASNPGPDFTGVLDALAAFDELKSAFTAVEEAKPADKPNACDALMRKIEALGKLWKVGPVMPGFFGPET